MQTSFWHQRWQTNEIGFHQKDGNPLLAKYFNCLALSRGSKVFVPLCGKTRDIAWLLANGYTVSGCELSELAVKQLFEELEVTPAISEFGALRLYQAPGIDIFVGDFFKLTNEEVNSIDAIYDRAALVALSENTRSQYSNHLMTITNNAPQLLLCYEYDQSLMAGPPFSINQCEVQKHYSKNYKLDLVASIDVLGGVRGSCAAKENVWVLKT